MLEKLNVKIERKFTYLCKFMTFKKSEIKNIADQAVQR